MASANLGVRGILSDESDEEVEELRSLVIDKGSGLFFVSMTRMSA